MTSRDKKINLSLRFLRAAAYACALADFGDLYDIVGLSSVGCILVKVAQNEMPRPWIVEGMKNLTAPPNCTRVIHVWHDDQDLPEVIAL